MKRGRPGLPGGEDEPPKKILRLEEMLVETIISLLLDFYRTNEEEAIIPFEEFGKEIEKLKIEKLKEPAFTGSFHSLSIFLLYSPLVTKALSFCRTKGAPCLP